jgi:hypothetical protein
MRSIFGQPEEGFRSRHTGPRWGARSLGFLLLALVAALTARALGGYTIGALGSLIFGLVGAGYCSYRGVRQAMFDGLLFDRNQNRQASNGDAPSGPVQS